MYEDITDEARHRALSNNSNISLYANNPKGKGNKKKGNSFGSSKTSKKYCNHCDCNGHLEEDCFMKYPEKKVAYNAKWAQQIKDHKEQKEQKDKKSNDSSASSGITLYAGTLISSAFKDS